MFFRKPGLFYSLYILSAVFNVRNRILSISGANTGCFSFIRSAEVEPEITEATIDDIEACSGLLDSLFTGEAEFSSNPEQQKRGLSMIIGNPEIGHILVMRMNGKTIGMVNLLYSVSTYLGGKTAILEDMIIADNYRNSGYGSRLLSEAVESAKKNGCLRITLLTDSTNTGAQRFYARQGFYRSQMVPMRIVF